MPRNRLVTEEIEEVKKFKNYEKKVEWLQKNASQALKSLLQWAYDERVIFNLPPGEPPYRPDRNPKGLSPATIDLPFTRRFYVLTKNDSRNKNVSKLRVERHFIDMLESVHPDEAKVLIQMKDRNIKGIPKRTACLAFPEIYTKEKKKEEDKLG